MKTREEVKQRISALELELEELKVELVALPLPPAPEPPKELFLIHFPNDQPNWYAENVQDAREKRDAYSNLCKGVYRYSLIGPVDLDKENENLLSN